MKITFQKGTARHRMTLRRQDGTTASADLGPNLPYHDLAHYVIERGLRIDEGFYGQIARGRSIADMSTTDAIRAMGPEALKAEILTRALQALLSGACTLESFTELANAEFAQWAIPSLEEPGTPMLRAMLEEYRALVERYRALKPDESLELEFGRNDQRLSDTCRSRNR